MSQTTNLFHKALFEAIDEGLLILGESGRDAIYFYLQNHYSITRENISENPRAFVEGIRKIFGIGANVIEKAIIISLQNKLEIECKEKKVYDFLAYLAYAKESVENERLK